VGEEMSALTVRLTEREERDLQWACEQTGKTKSEVVRELLAEFLRGYRLRQSLQAAHAELGAAARQSGWLTAGALVLVTGDRRVLGWGAQVHMQILSPRDAWMRLFVQGGVN